jgi:type II secretory pathway component PulM
VKARFEQLRAQSLAWWLACAPRERRTIAALIAILAIALFAWLAHSIQKSRAELRNTIPALRARADLVNQQAAEFERLRAAPGATVSPADLRSLVQGSTGTAGLSRAVTSIEAFDTDHVKIVFGAVAFADWLGWVAGLETLRIQIESCRIEALSVPGTVSITAALVRPRLQ